MKISIIIIIFAFIRSCTAVLVLEGPARTSCLIHKSTEYETDLMSTSIQTCNH